MVASTRTVLKIFAVLTAQTYSAVSGEDCRSEALTIDPCFSNLMTEILNPKLGMRKDQPINITEPQINAICRLGQMLFPCVAGYAEHCIPQMLHMSESIQRSADLLRVCDQPNLYSKAQTLLTCYNTSPIFQSCFANLIEGQQDKQRSLTKHSSSAFELLQTGSDLEMLLLDQCCRLKKFQRCVSSDLRERCTSEAAKLETDAYDAVFAANSCQNKICSGDVPLKTSSGGAVSSYFKYSITGSVLIILHASMIRQLSL